MTVKLNPKRNVYLLHKINYFFGYPSFLLKIFFQIFTIVETILFLVSGKQYFMNMPGFGTFLPISL